MIIFKQISIQNFLSFGKKPTVVNLNVDDSTLIIGKNSDTGSEGYSRNGVGKSSIFQALSWVLFNEGLSSIKQDAFINVTNKKKMVVSLDLEVDGIEYQIQRGRKPAVCQILKDGEPYTMHSVGTVDETIEKLIGINFDTFTNTTLLNTNTIPFMNMKPAPQRNFMEKMLGLDILTERADFLKMKNRELGIDIKMEEQNKVHVEGVYEKTKNRIELLTGKKTNWDESTAKEIESTIKETKALEEVDIDEQKDLIVEYEKQEVQLKEIRQEISELKSDEKKELDDHIKNIDETFEKHFTGIQIEKKEKESESQQAMLVLMEEKEQRTTTLGDDKDLLNQVNNFIKEKSNILETGINLLPVLEKEKTDRESGICPECFQPHIDKGKVEKLDDRITDINKEINEISEEFGEVLPQQETLEESVQKETDSIKQDFQNKSNDVQSELRSVVNEFDERRKQLNTDKDSEISVAKKTIADKFTDRKRLLDDSIEDTKKDMVEPALDMEACHHIIHGIEQNKLLVERKKKEVNPYTEQVELANKDLIEYDKQVLYNMKSKEDHFKILIKLLTDNKSFVRKNLLDQYVPFINQKVEHYLDILELPHRIRFNNDLSVDVEYMAQSISYGNMSNGERGRTNFAVSMAFRDLMSISGHQFNFLGIDELLDNGIDQSGFQSIFKLLKKRNNENVFIISHRDDLLTEVSNIMTVEKKGGFTVVHND